MKYIIYKTTNTINNKVYVGKHQTENIYDGYLGSGVALQNAIKKYGKNSFNKEILYIFDNEDDMNAKEKELVNESFISTDMTYNMGIGGEGGSHFKGKKHSEETKQKIRESRKNKTFSEETRKKIADANRKRTLSEETKKKLSDNAKKRFASLEERERHSKLMKSYFDNKSK